MHLVLTGIAHGLQRIHNLFSAMLSPSLDGYPVSIHEKYCYYHWFILLRSVLYALLSG